MRLSTPAAPSSSESSEKTNGASSLFIRKVQHLIERCLTFYLDVEECVTTLSKHAHIDPIITRTVWKELEKANPDFFERYHLDRATGRGLPLTDEESDNEGNTSALTTDTTPLQDLEDTCSQK